MAANIVVQVLLDELQRRALSRQITRNLRDTSDPFQLPEEQFRKFYRLSREAAYDLYVEVDPHLQISRRNTKTPKILKFIMALHFFSHGSYQKSVGKDYHSSLSQSSVSKCLNEVIGIIMEHLIDTYIRFPTNLRDITAVKNDFYEKFEFPGVVGCIDCTHIAITPPPANHLLYPGLVYINRKIFHSINCQIVCDSNLKILQMNARFPGSVHDAAIWMVSSVKQFLSQNYANNDRSTWLLGDSGYPLQPFLLTPIVGADPETPEGRYTTRHCLARNTVERCIGVMKAYFRCLHKDRVLHYKPPIAAKIIYCCGLLHNILRSRNIIDVHLENEIDNDSEDDDDDDNEQDIEPVNMLQEGRAIRNNLIGQHFA